MNVSIYTIFLAIFLAVAGFALLGFSNPITNFLGGICAIVCALMNLLGRN